MFEKVMEPNIVAAIVTQIEQLVTKEMLLKFQIGDCVLICTKDRTRIYKKKGQKRVAKLMLRYDSPFMVTGVHPKSSNVTVF